MIACETDNTEKVVNKWLLYFYDENSLVDNVRIKKRFWKGMNYLVENGLLSIKHGFMEPPSLSKENQTLLYSLSSQSSEQ